MADRRSAATKAQAAANPGGDKYKAPASDSRSDYLKGTLNNYTIVGSKTAGTGYYSTNSQNIPGGQAHDQRQFRESQIIAQQRQQQEENARREREENYNQEERSSAKEKTYEGNKEYSTSTGNYERGGYVVQETRGDAETLKTLGKQQPGSSLVQNEGGEYLLIRSTGLNLGNEATLNKLNENIALEGGSKYYPTERKNSKGGTDHFIRLKESLGLSEEISGYTSSPVQSETGGKAYSIELSETISRVSPTEHLHSQFNNPSEYEMNLFVKNNPRLVSESITKGKNPNLFIGPQGADILNLESEYNNTQKFKPKQIFPLTYTDSKGKPLVTITGKGPGTDYQILGEKKTVDLSYMQGGTKPETNKIFPFPLEAKTTGKNIVQLSEEKSPLYPYLGGNPNPFREVTKGAVKGGVQIAIEIGNVFVPSEISGIKDEKTREEFVTKFEQAYPKELQPRETPLVNLISGKGFQTPYGASYDIRAGAFEIVLLATGVPKLESIPKFTFRSGASKVREAEYVLKEPGVVQGSTKLNKDIYLLEKGTEGRSYKVTSKLEELPIEVTRKGSIVSAKYPKQPKTVIIPEKGLPAQIPLTVIETGKGKEAITEIRAIKTKEIVQSPKELNVYGSPNKTLQTQLGLQQVSRFHYQSKNLTPESKVIYAREVKEKRLVPFAIGKKAPLDLVLSGEESKLRAYTFEKEPVYLKKTISEGTKPSADVVAKLESGYNYKPEGGLVLRKVEYEYSKKYTPIVFAQAKAEKVINYEREADIFKKLKLDAGYGPRTNPNVPRVYKSSRPWDVDLTNITPRVGAGQSGKATKLGPEESKLIQAGYKSAIQKPREDFLGSIRSPVYLSAMESESLLIQYPPSSTPAHITSTIQTPQSYQKSLTATKQPQRSQTITTQKLSISQEGKSILDQATKLSTKTVQKTLLKTQLRTELMPRFSLVPRQETRSRLAQIPRQVQRQKQIFRQVLVPEIPFIPKEKLQIPKLVFFAPTPRLKKGRSKESEKGSRLDFLGNSPLDSIIGLYKRKEITYGDKTIASLLRKERRGGKSKRKKAKKKSNKGIGISFF